MLTSFLVLPHMVKLVVTHTHIWAYRKSKGAEERIIFIYILLKIRLEIKFQQSFNQVLDVIIYRQEARSYVRRISETILSCLKTGCRVVSENTYYEASVTTATR
jgi:hypothetical protein